LLVVQSSVCDWSINPVNQTPVYSHTLRDNGVRNGWTGITHTLRDNGVRNGWTGITHTLCDNIREKCKNSAAKNIWKKMMGG
jgi:hypothetical protein